MPKVCNAVLNEENKREKCINGATGAILRICTYETFNS